MDDEQKKSGEDLDLTAVEKAFHDLEAANKAGDKEEVAKLLTSLKKAVDEVATDEAPTNDDDNEQADPFEKKLEQYQ